MEAHKVTISLWLVLFVVFLDWMGIGLVYPMFSSMLFHPNGQFADLGVSEGMKGWCLGGLLATFSIAQFFSSPILGTLSDAKGRKPLFLISLSLGVIGYGFCFLAVSIKSILGLIASRALVGISAGNAAVATAVIADLSTKENKTKHFGLYSMACGLGFTIGPFLGGILSKVSSPFPFLFAGVAVFFNLAFILLFFKETHLERKKGSSEWHKGIVNLKKAFQIPGLRILFLSVFIYLFGWSFFYEFIPVSWIADYGFDAAMIGILYAYGAAIYALSVSGKGTPSFSS